MVSPPPPANHLTTEAVEGAALALQGVDNVERRDSLALRVLRVGNGITDDTLKETLENAAGLLVDHCATLLEAVAQQEMDAKRARGTGTTY